MDLSSENDYRSGFLPFYSDLQHLLPILALIMSNLELLSNCYRSAYLASKTGLT